MKSFVAALSLLCIPGLVLACPVRLRVIAPVAVVKEVITPVAVVKEVAVAVLTPFAVPVPTYGFGYPSQGAYPCGQAPQQSAPAGQGNREVLDALAAISKRLDRLEGRQSAEVPERPRKAAPPQDRDLPTADPAPREEPALPDPVGVYKGHCVQCHTQATKAKGKGFAYFDDAGKLLPSVTDKDRLKMIKRVNKNEMPPPKNKSGVPQCSDAEAASIVEDLGQ